MTAEQRNAVVQAGFKICAWPRAFRHDAQAALDLVFDEQTLTAAYRDCIQSNDANIKVCNDPILCSHDFGHETLSYYSFSRHSQFTRFYCRESFYCVACGVSNDFVSSIMCCEEQ